MHGRSTIRQRWPRTLLLVRPFAPFRRLIRPRLTPRSAFPRRPLCACAHPSPRSGPTFDSPAPYGLVSHETRSPLVRAHSFAAQPPDLRHLALITRASRFLARSPCRASPSIRFLLIGSQLRSALSPYTRSPSCSCASLRSPRSTYERTFTSKSAAVPDAQTKNPGRVPGFLAANYQTHITLYDAA